MSSSIDKCDVLIIKELKVRPQSANQIINQNLPMPLISRDLGLERPNIIISRPEIIHRLERLKTLGYVKSENIFARSDEEILPDYIEWSLTEKAEEIMEFIS